MDVSQLESLIEVLDWFCHTQNGCQTCYFDLMNCPLLVFVEEINKVIKDIKKKGL